jgi:hypothetical protein
MYGVQYGSYKTIPETFNFNFLTSYVFLYFVCINILRVVNAFETCCWRRMLKIKWTDRITNDEVFQRAKEERLFLKS